MARLVWGSRPIEQGVDRGVLYLSTNFGVAWVGLVSVTDAPLFDSVTGLYFDGTKYLDAPPPEDAAFTLEAYTYPDEFEEYEGSEGKRFGLSYRVLADPYYTLHLVYNARASLSAENFRTRAAETELSLFSWSIATTPIDIPGARPGAHLYISTEWADPRAIADLELILYGTTSFQARLPTPEEIIAICEAYLAFIVIDHGDGTWTAIGSASAIQMLDPESFQISVSSAVWVDSESYTLSSS